MLFCYSSHATLLLIRGRYLNKRKANQWRVETAKMDDDDSDSETCSESPLLFFLFPLYRNHALVSIDVLVTALEVFWIDLPLAKPLH